MRLLTYILLFTISPVSNIQADNLGRLFFTPEYRTQLDYDLAHNTSGGDAQSSVLMVNGIVQRHDSARTVWINGTAQSTSHGDDPTTETVTPPGESKSVKIKVGEKLLLDTLKSQSSPASAE